MASSPLVFQQFVVPGTVVEVDATPKGYETLGPPSIPYVFQAAGNAVRITIEHRGGEAPIIYSCTGGRDLEGVKATEAPEAPETTTQAAGTNSETK